MLPSNNDKPGRAISELKTVTRFLAGKLLPIIISGFLIQFFGDSPVFQFIGFTLFFVVVILIIRDVAKDSTPEKMVSRTIYGALTGSIFVTLIYSGFTSSWNNRIISSVLPYCAFLLIFGGAVVGLTLVFNDSSNGIETVGGVLAGALVGTLLFAIPVGFVGIIGSIFGLVSWEFLPFWTIWGGVMGGGMGFLFAKPL